MLLKNRIFLVTGADCGIGAAIVDAALKEGARVIAHSLKPSAGQSNASLNESGRDLQVYGDLNIKSNIDTLWADALAWHGRIDVLVNNADIYASSPLHSPANWELGWKTNISINLEAPAALCRHAMQHFEISGPGTIINLHTRKTLHNDKEYLAYHATKGGLIALSQRISRSYASRGTVAYVVTPAVQAVALLDDTSMRIGDYWISAGIPIFKCDTEQLHNIVQITTLLAAGKIAKPRPSSDEGTDKFDVTGRQTEVSKR